MNLEKMLRENLKMGAKFSKEDRSFFKFILGEFNRFNDGKKCTDEQCIKIVKKLIKNSKEILNIKSDIKTERELYFLESLLPKQADEKLMRDVIDYVMETQDFKNKMQLMRPCINELQYKGYDVDKAKLSSILKES